jgi:serine/threonine protein kinase
MQNILLIHNDPKQRSTLMTFLASHSFFVVGAADATAGQEALDKKSFDLILLDETLPDLSGISFTKALRQDPLWAEVPVFLMLDSNNLKAAMTALRAGVTECISKPINYSQLLDKLENLSPAVSLLGPPQPPEVGDLLDEKYRIEAKLGQGGCGVVFRALHLEMNRPVAIKVLHSAPTDKNAVARFRVEAMASSKIQHPNVVSVFDFSANEKQLPYLVLELLNGGSLQDELNRYRALSIKRSVDIFLPICHALAQAHQSGVVHRDIKPSNIFIHKTASAFIPKLLDFGMAKMTDPNSQAVQTAKGFVVGTLSYMAPERLAEKPYDGKADIYSLGVTLYETLSGALPFVAPGDNPLLLAGMHLKQEPPPIQKYRPALPDDIAAFVTQCLSKLPGMRPSAVEFAQKLETFRGL